MTKENKPKLRNEKGHWVKGQSGNPDGAAIVFKESRQSASAYLAQHDVPEKVLAFLVATMNDADGRKQDRLKAAQQLADICGLKNLQPKTQSNQSVNNTLASMLQTAFTQQGKQIEKLEAQVKQTELVDVVDAEFSDPDSQG